MNTKMMFGLLTVLVAVVAVSTIALPTLASSIEDSSNNTDPNVPDTTPIQDDIQTRQRLRICNQTCTENCTQTRAQIRAMDGSCSVGDGTCTGEGMQYRGSASVQGGLGVSTQGRSRGRNQSGTCIAAQIG